MAKSSSILNSKRTRAPQGFFICLALVIAFELCVYFFPEHALFDAPYGEKSLEIKNATADTSNTYDILILGDCFGWAGIRPVAMKRNLGAATFNLSISNSQMFMIEYVLLKRYLQNASRKPKLVIFQISAYSLMKQAEIDFDFLRTWLLPYFRMDADILEEFSEKIRKEYRAYMFWLRLPSIRRQFLLKKPWWLTRIWTSSRDEYESSVQDNIIFENGFYNMNEALGDKNRAFGWIRDINEDLKNGKFSDYNITYIKKILSLLESYDIKTIVVAMPVKKEALFLWNIYNTRNRFVTKTLDIINEHKGLLFWDRTNELWDSGYFFDEIHLNSKGADKFSDELSAEIKRLNLL